MGLLLFSLLLCVAYSLGIYAIDNKNSGSNSELLFDNVTVTTFPAPTPGHSPHLHHILRVPGRGAVFAFDEPTGAYGELCGSESPTFSSSGTAQLIFVDALNGVSKVVLDVSKVNPLLRAVVDVSISPSNDIAYAIATLHKGGE